MSEESSQFDPNAFLQAIRLSTSNFVKVSLQQETGLDYGLADTACTRELLGKIKEGIAEYENFLFAAREAYACLLVDEYKVELFGVRSVTCSNGYYFSTSKEEPYMDALATRRIRDIANAVSVAFSVLELESQMNDEAKDLEEHFHAFVHKGDAYAKLLSMEALRLEIEKS